MNITTVLLVLMMIAYQADENRQKIAQGKKNTVKAKKEKQWQGAISKAKKANKHKKDTMKRKRLLMCNGDCFNCSYDDCIKAETRADQIKLYQAEYHHQRWLNDAEYRKRKTENTRKWREKKKEKKNA